MRYTFLADSYETESLKVVSVWSLFEDNDLEVRPRADDVRGRSVREQMVHQCVSEDTWFRNMLGIDVAAPPLPRDEHRLAFISRYAEDARKRLDALRRAGGWMVGSGNRVFRRAAIEGLGRDPQADPYVTPPRATDGDAQDARANRVQQLWSYRRHWRIDAGPRADDLRLFQPGRAADG